MKKVLLQRVGYGEQLQKRNQHKDYAEERDRDRAGEVVGISDPSSSFR
jgi:hypothetical protein